MDVDQLLPDPLRKLENFVRLGTVALVRHEQPGTLVRVRSGGLLADWRPYHELSAGNTRTWNPLTVGEQVTLLLPGGDLAAAIVIGGIHQNSQPTPSTDPNETMTVYPDGATFIYDHSTHALTITLPGGGTADITVSDLITVTCKTADVTATDSATVHSKLITLDAPDTVATGNLLVKKTLTYMQGMMGYGVAPGAASSAEVRGNITVRYGSLDLKEGGVKASEDVQAGAISLRPHALPRAEGT